MGGVNGDRRGKKRGRDSSPHSFFFFFFPSFSLLLCFLHQLQACGPTVWVQSNCVHRIPLVSFVNTGAGSACERMALIQNSSNGGLSSRSPIPALTLSPLAVSSSFGWWWWGGALMAARVKSIGRLTREGGALTILSSQERGGVGGGVCEGQQEKCGPTCH